MSPLGSLLRCGTVSKLSDHYSVVRLEDACRKALTFTPSPSLKGEMRMNSVGIDVSKGKSMIAVMRPFGELVVPPFEIHHTDSELCELTKLLSGLSGETRVVMESTGNYHFPVAWLLNDSGFYVSVVNAMLVHDYRNNSLRRAKTDKKDAIKLANYGLDHWLTLPRYVPEEDTRLMLKNCYRQYQQYSKVQTMLKNNLISLLKFLNFSLAFC